MSKRLRLSSLLMMLTVRGGLAEFERHLILARTAEGRVPAQVRGVKFGRKPALTKHQQVEALARRGGGRSVDGDCADLQRKPLNDLQACTTMTPLERRVKIALGAGLTAPAIARLLRINVGKARRIAVKMALERMNAELARSRVQLDDPA